MSLRKSTADRSRDNKSYNVYCLNFHGSGLQTIKHEFKRQVETGLRRPVFILDLEDLQNDLDNQTRSSKQLRDYKDNPSAHLMTAVVESLQNFRKEYDIISKKINDELKFDLYQYWLKDLEDKHTESLADATSLKGQMSLTASASGKAKAKSDSKLTKANRISKKSLGNGEAEAGICKPLVLREHNRVCQGEMLSKRTYIKDDPAGGKLYFIIIGSMNEQFYLDLLSRGQPVQGIINFVPTESNYDIMLNNNKLRQFIMQSLESINNSLYQLRQEISLKPVGLFLHNLPVISQCLATKHQRDIFDQLTWSVFDIEMLQQQYNNYYLRPFQETDVELPPSVQLQQLYQVADSLSLQGQFQTQPPAGNAADIATIVAYVNSLLNTCALPDGVLSEKEVILLSMTDYKLPKWNTAINDLIRAYSSAFVGITKVRKFERLFIDDTNKLMVNMLQYADQKKFKNIYLSCLEYNLWRKYITPPNVPKTIELKCPFDLPEFVQLYCSEDSCCQKISELMCIYDDVQIQEIQPDVKLYTFVKTCNAIIEQEQLEVIPTRLCFRDFCLFQMEEFLENLITSDMRTTSKDNGRKSSFSKSAMGRRSKTFDFDDSIFIRRNSLKAVKLTADRESEQTPTQREKEQRSSRKQSRQYSKKSSSRLSDGWAGLPPGHHLIKGYNLEDTRQEVRTKTCRYHFHHGSVQLYEEKWCFQDMNQTLRFAVNDNNMYLTRPRYQDSGINNNLRLYTRNNVGIRILNEPQECAKVVMNYPNGLVVYYHHLDCEQVWCGENTYRDEKRRIYTPYGAVVVFYQTDHMILIMRYNGEVYRLYQYDLPEEEEEEDMLSEFSNNQSSETGDVKAQGDSPKREEQRDSKLKGHQSHKGQGDNTVNKTKLGINPPPAISKEPSTCPSTPQADENDHLKAAINDELTFLYFIASMYELSYVRLKVITSQGRRFGITFEGQISEASPCHKEEWHDYYANECYCLRSDGVKMIWTAEVLKCYHKDGSVFTTKTEEGLETIDNDGNESQISQSSSHQQMEDEATMKVGNKSRQHNSSPTTMAAKGYPSRNCEPNTTNYKDYLAPEVEEEHEDIRYVRYSCSSWLMQHYNYAGVYILWTTPSCPVQPSLLMEILGIDNIFIYTRKEENDKESSCSAKSLEGDSLNGGSGGKDQNLLVNVWIGDNLHFTVSREGCEIFAILERQSGQDEEEDCIMCDSLTLKIMFKDCLTDVYKYLIKEIATFHNYNGPMKEKLYFVEVLGKDCKRKGFEFLNSLPKSSNYKRTFSNCIIEAKPLKTFNQLMTHCLEGYEKDMHKFPRFCSCKTTKPLQKMQDFPMVLTSSIFCRVPSSLRNTQHIHKFLVNFDNVNFKKFHSKFKQLLDYHLRPNFQLDIKKIYSAKNWLQCHREHERRKFMETQRLGLYHAMLKHHVFPNYFKFTQDYRGQICDVEFFDFLQDKCKNKEVLKEEVDWVSQNARRHSEKSTPAKRSRAKTKQKCKYGTYDNQN